MAGLRGHYRSRVRGAGTQDVQIIDFKKADLGYRLRLSTRRRMPFYMVMLLKVSRRNPNLAGVSHLHQRVYLNAGCRYPSAPSSEVVNLSSLSPRSRLLFSHRQYSRVVDVRINERLSMPILMACPVMYRGLYI